MAGGRKKSGQRVTRTGGDHSLGKGSKLKDNLRNIEEELTVIQEIRVKRGYKSPSKESVTPPKALQKGRKSKKGIKCGHCKNHHSSKEEVKSCSERTYRTY